MQRALCIRTPIQGNSTREGKRYRYEIQEGGDSVAGILMSFFLGNVSGDRKDIAEIFSCVSQGKPIWKDDEFCVSPFGADEVEIEYLDSPENYPCGIILKKEVLLEGMRQWIRVLRKQKSKIILKFSDDHKICVYNQY